MKKDSKEAAKMEEGKPQIIQINEGEEGKIGGTVPTLDSWVWNFSGSLFFQCLMHHMKDCLVNPSCLVIFSWEWIK